MKLFKTNKFKTSKSEFNKFIFGKIRFGKTRLGKSRRPNGFTLVEILIYMGLFTGFLIILTGVFVSTLEVQSESAQTARIEQDSHYLFARLQYDISRATDLTTPATNGDTTNSLVITVPEGELTYYFEDESVKLSLSGGTGEVVTSSGIKVDQLEFLRLANEDGVPSVRTQIHLSSSPLGSFSPEERSLTYTFGLR